MCPHASNDTKDSHSCLCHMTEFILAYWDCLEDHLGTIMGGERTHSCPWADCSGSLLLCYTTATALSKCNSRCWIIITYKLSFPEHLLISLPPILRGDKKGLVGGGPPSLGHSAPPTRWLPFSWLVRTRLLQKPFDSPSCQPLQDTHCVSFAGIAVIPIHWAIQNVFYRWKLPVPGRLWIETIPINNEIITNLISWTVEGGGTTTRSGRPRPRPFPNHPILFF